MDWAVICHELERFAPAVVRQGEFRRGEVLMLLDSDSEDREDIVYVTDQKTCDRAFHHALIVSIGFCGIESDSMIALSCGSLSQVFNALLTAKRWLDTLDGRLSGCNSEQEILNAASDCMGLPMFYLDNSYRIRAITREPPSADDLEWQHMTEHGYLSPESARRMQERGDLEVQAVAHGPEVYNSGGIYPFTSIVCNVWSRSAFAGRFVVLCVNREAAPPVIEACSIVANHLERLLDPEGGMLSDGPLQSVLADLLRGVSLSEKLIADRLRPHPALNGGWFRLFYVELDGEDRQVTPYYTSLIKEHCSGDNLLPLTFDKQLVLLAHAGSEDGFAPLVEKLRQLFDAYHLRCGVSNAFRRVADLRGYLEQAQASLRGQQSGSLLFYQDRMLEHIISYIPAERTEFLISPELLRLRELEGEYSFSLTDTLRAYLFNNCSLNQTAAELFLHKNTMLYRLNHIKSILRCDLDDADERLLLMLSFKLMERGG